MMAPSRALQLTCRAGAAVPLCAGPFQQLVEFQTAYATLAIPIQAPPVQFVLPHETSDVAEAKNVCNQVRFLKRNLLQRPKAFRSVICEMAGDLPFPLLFRAIAKVREALQRHAPEATLIRGRAKVRPRRGRVRLPPAQLRVDMIAAANPGADDDPARLPTFRQAVTDNGHR